MLLTIIFHFELSLASFGFCQPTNTHVKHESFGLSVAQVVQATHVFVCVCVCVGGGGVVK